MATQRDAVWAAARTRLNSPFDGQAQRPPFDNAGPEPVEGPKPDSHFDKLWDCPRR